MFERTAKSLDLGKLPKECLHCFCICIPSLQLQCWQVLSFTYADPAEYARTRAATNRGHSGAKPAEPRRLTHMSFESAMPVCPRSEQEFLVILKAHSATFSEALNIGRLSHSARPWHWMASSVEHFA